MFSCQPEVEFTAGTENKLTGIVDFGSFNADFTSDGNLIQGGVDYPDDCCAVEQWMIDEGYYSQGQLGLCLDYDSVDISTDEDATGSEKYVISISASDLKAEPNYCDNDSWDGIEHELRIRFIADELKDQYQIISGNFAHEHPTNIENPYVNVEYYLHRFNESQGDIERFYEGTVANLDIVEFNTNENYVSGSFYGTVYREDSTGSIDSVMLKNFVFNKINIID
tara:strand:- start:220 stop:891 length:672 start_codon:yes stop_codon:yes gene_type:complete